MIYLVSLFMTTFPMSMISMIEDEDDSLLYTFKTGWWLSDGLLNQYLVPFGDWGNIVENAASNPLHGVTLLLFLATTIFTSLTMLNMLIAIMGDTFAQAMENKHVNSLRTKLDILSD